MENSIYLGLSKQNVLQTDMQIIANNVANLSTPGFRGQNTLFEEYISRPSGADDPLSFVNDRGQYQNTDQGSISVTGNPLDIALNGPGFIAIDAPGGQAFTRDGSFQLTADGLLVTSAGFPVSGGITVPSDGGAVSIDSSGVVSNEDGQLGQIEIVEFENVQLLEPIGNNLYSNEGPTQDAGNTTVTQGALEGSNVNAVLEMTRMIETMRTFQSVQRLMDNENDRMRNAIRKLTGSQ